MSFQQHNKSISRPLTYISLFGSDCVGCYGFKQANFQCIEREMWEMVEDVDVVIATPPCQDATVDNHGKASVEIVRNSLVVETIKLVLKIKPKVFIFENEKNLQSSIQDNIGKDYSYVWEVINFKDYEDCSRTVVIGVRKDMADDISPYDIFPRINLGESVPVVAFHDIAIQLKEILEKQRLTEKEASDFILKRNLTSKKELIDFIHLNAEKYTLSSLMRLSELANTKRTENGAYYTNKSIITEIIKRLPSTQEKTIRILEPSVGVGGFIPYIARRFASHEVFIDVVDIDSDSLDIFQAMLEHMNLPSNIHVNIICDDFLLHEFSESYDYVIGNPPFGKVSKQNKDLPLYIRHAYNKTTKNIFSFFLDKCYTIADTVALVLPKAVLNAPEFAISRSRLSDGGIFSILDFGEHGFKGVLVETVCIICSPTANAQNTTVFNMTDAEELIQKQSYITDSFYPYWILYRNAFFDSVSEKLKFNCFTVFRDRQITNSMLNSNTGVRVLKSRNISDDGKEILDVAGYDSYMSLDLAQKLAVYKYVNDEDVYMTPNMTYKPRVMQKPKGLIVNGSVALLFPRKDIEVTKRQLEYFSSDEYRKFYRIARNKQTRSLNVDSCSVFFFGLLQLVN